MHSITEADDHLKNWISSLLPEVNVSLRHPSAVGTGVGISMFLYRMISPPTRNFQAGSPLQVVLKYLVTAHDEEIRREHEIISELVFAALKSPQFETELFPAAQAQLIEKPYFVISVTISRMPDQVEIERVKKPVVVKPALKKSVVGVISNQEGKPLSDVKITVPSIHYSTRTSDKGLFSISYIPAGIDQETFIRSLVFSKDNQFIKTRDIRAEQKDHTVVINVTTEG